jgi:hypothetical protein
MGWMKLMAEPGITVLGSMYSNRNMLRKSNMPKVIEGSPRGHFVKYLVGTTYRGHTHSNHAQMLTAKLPHLAMIE